MWFYIENDDRKGPVDESEVEGLVADAVITRTTQVWKKGMSGWSNAQDTELSELLRSQPPEVPVPSQPPEVPVRPRSGAMPPSNTGGSRLSYSPESFKVLWHVFVWTGAAYFAVLFIFLSIMLAQGPYRHMPGGAIGLFTVVMLALLIVIAGAWLTFLYRCWAIIQGRHARTTPGKAVGFMFIPFFNLYWVFVSIYGLAQDMNRHVSSVGGADKPINEGLTLAACILMVCGAIPYIGLIPVLLSTVFLYIVMYKMAGVAGHIIKQQRQTDTA